MTGRILIKILQRLIDVSLHVYLKIQVQNIHLSLMQWILA